MSQRCDPDRATLGAPRPTAQQEEEQAAALTGDRVPGHVCGCQSRYNFFDIRKTGHSQGLHLPVLFKSRCVLEVVPPTPGIDGSHSAHRAPCYFEHAPGATLPSGPGIVSTERPASQTDTRQYAGACVALLTGVVRRLPGRLRSRA